MRSLDPQERWNLSYEITGILAEASDAQSAVDEILASVGNAFGFVAGSFWVVDELRVVLRSTTFWTAKGRNFPSFELVTRVRSLSHGEGLPGTSWKLREAVWFPDVQKELNFPRASVASLDGLHAGVAFPAYHARRVFGAFEFFSDEPLASDGETLRFLSALGVQVGLFLQHYGVQEDLIEEGETLRIAADRSLDAVLTIDENSTVIYANSAVFRLLGWKPEDLIGGRLTQIMPEHLRPMHEGGIRRYIETGIRNLDWSAIELPALHRDGHIVLITVAFGEFWRTGQRVFTGFIRPSKASSPTEI